MTYIRRSPVVSGGVTAGRPDAGRLPILFRATPGRDPTGAQIARRATRKSGRQGIRGNTGRASRTLRTSAEPLPLLNHQGIRRYLIRIVSGA